MSRWTSPGHGLDERDRFRWNGRMQKIRIILGGLGALLAWFAFTNYRVWSANPEVTTIAFADYVAKRPEARWLRLTGCHASPADQIVIQVTDSRSGKNYADEVYVPVWPDASKTGPVHVLVKNFGVRKEGDLAFCSEEELASSWTSSVHGLATPLEDIEKESRGVLAGVEDLDLAGDCVVLDAVEWPTVDRWRGPAIGSALSLLVFGATFLRRRAPKQA